MSVFKFKEFSVQQEASAMKIGTDAMIFGSLISVEHKKNALDIGTGTGVLALMLAQRSADLNLIGLEIEAEAFNEAKFNFENSPFKSQLIAVHDDFLQFENTPFDLIFSNPPYFENSSKANSSKRNLARHDDRLPLIELFQRAYELLTEDGHFWIILPATTVDEYVPIVEKFGLYPEEIISIYGTENKLIRKVVSFKKHRKSIVLSELIVRNSDGRYTEMYKKLTEAYHFNQLK